jgi:hypothetical protein
MKNLILIAIGLIMCFAANAQYTQTITPDSVNGAETVYFKTVELNKGGSVALQTLATETGGTTDGTIVIQGSTNGVNFATLSDETGLFKGFPNDSITMTDSTIGLWVIQNNPFLFIRFKVAGTSGDSSIVAQVIYQKINNNMVFTFRI